MAEQYEAIRKLQGAITEYTNLVGDSTDRADINYAEFLIDQKFGSGKF